MGFYRTRRRDANQKSTSTRCQITKRILPVDDVCGDDAPTFDVSSAVTADSEVADEILDAATQQVILNFDGHVTITMD